MKKLIVTSVLAVIFVGCTDQKLPVAMLPKPVVKSFGLAYPQIASVDWYKEKYRGKTVYAASWKKDGKRSIADFDEKGNFIREQ